MIKFKKNGFSIIELIIAGSISITAIGIGYSLLQIALKGNKIDETQMGINGRINDTLDFILDEDEITIWLFIFTFFFEMIDCNLFLEIELTFSFKNISILLNPIIPISTKKVLNTINIPDKDISLKNIEKDIDSKDEIPLFKIKTKKHHTPSNKRKTKKLNKKTICQNF